MNVKKKIRIYQDIAINMMIDSYDINLSRILEEKQVC